MLTDSDLSGSGRCSSNGSMGYEREDNEEGPPRALSDSPRDAVVEDDLGQSQPEAAVKESNQEEIPA